jgi:hypothetical protein
MQNSIIRQIEDFIQSALNHTYNSQVSEVSYIISSDGQTCRDSISNSCRTINLEITPRQKSLESQYFLYRFPQTRLYYSELQNKDFCLKTIERFDHFIVIIKNYKEDGNIHFKINFNESYNKISSGKFLRQSDNSFSFSVKDEILIWFNKEKKYNEIKSLPGFLEEVYRSEITNHPISQINCQNKDVLIKIDNLWSALDIIGQGHTIKIDQLLKKRFADFIWLQELYLHFGWFEELFAAYLNLEINSDANLSKKDKELLLFCYERFLYAAKQMDWSVPKKLSFLSINKNKSKILKQFLNYFLMRKSINHNQLAHKIQQHWERIHAPVLDYYFKKEVIEDADEYIAFMLLALEGRFWWAEKLQDKINQALTNSTVNLFNLLMRLKFPVNLSIDKDCFSVSKLEKFSNVEALSNQSGFYFKYVELNKLQYTHFYRNENFNFKIDKFAKIIYRENNKEITIEPLLYQPPLIQREFRTTEISIDGYLLNVPLIWNQFVIEFNKSRFKFLLKKNRWQISLKLNRLIKDIKIDKTEITSADQIYQKYYIEIPKQESKIHLEIYNEYGVRLSEFGSYLKQITVRGYGLNVFGILTEKFRASRSSSKRTIEIFSNKAKPQLIAANTKDLTLRFFSGKCSPVEYNLKETEGLPYRIRNSSSEMFKNKLVIYLQNYNISLINQVRKLFFKKLAFYPEIKPFNQKKFNRKSFVFIIGKDSNKQGIVFKDIRIIKLNNKSNIKGIFIAEKDISKFFKSDFILNLLKKAEK